jgi:hypothetical protein
MAEASALDSALDVRLSEIRTQRDRGQITTREAADARIAALEDHLDRVRELRTEYFGSDE